MTFGDFQLLHSHTISVSERKVRSSSVPSLSHINHTE